MALPNDSITVTPGTGATVATHTVDGKEYQVVIQAGASGHILDTLDTYIAYADNVAFAANKSFLSIFNDMTSTKIVKIRKLFLINLATAAVVGVGVRFEIRKATAHSLGTLITPELMDTANAALPANVTVRTGATVVDGSLLFAHATNNDEVGLTNAFPTPTLQAGLNLMPEHPVGQDLALRANQGMTVKMTTSTVVGSYGVLCLFTVQDA